MLVAGVKTRIVSIALVPVLIGATWVHAGNGWLFTSPNGGWEYPAFWTIALLVQALLGDGAYALRAAFRRQQRKRPDLDDLAHRPHFLTLTSLEEIPMKLYFSPGACSLAPHIALHEVGLPFTAVKVDLHTHKLADGTDYYTVNAKGYVPLLELPDGERLSRSRRHPAIHRRPQARYARPGVRDDGTLPSDGVARLHCHRSAQAVCSAVVPDDARGNQGRAARKLATRFDHIAKTLAAKPYLTGEAFTIADAYLFTVLNWSGTLKVDLARWPALQQFQARVAARTKVREAMKTERLLKEPAQSTKTGASAAA